MFIKHCLIIINNQIQRLEYSFYLKFTFFIFKKYFLHNNYCLIIIKSKINLFKMMVQAEPFSLETNRLKKSLKKYFLYFNKQVGVNERILPRIRN